MHQTNKLMVGVTAAMLLASPVPAISTGRQPDSAQGATQQGQSRTVAPEVEAVEKKILLLLDGTSSEAARSQDELMQKLPGTPRKVAEQAIAELMLKEQIHRVGDGTNQDPYRYWYEKTHIG